MDSSVQVVILIIGGGISSGGVGRGFISDLLFLHVGFSSRVSRSNNLFFNIGSFFNGSTLNLRYLLGNDFDSADSLGDLSLNEGLV